MKTLAAGGEGTLTEPLKVARDRLLEGLHSDRDKPDHTFLLYAQDGKGMGHIARSLTIAGHLLEAYPNSTAYVVTESPVTNELPLPKGCTFVKLPTHLASGALPKTEQDDEAYDQHLSDERARILRRVALELAPDLVLVDHEPFGHRGEFRAGLIALKAHNPSTRFVLGLRDIMDDVGRIREKWEAMGVYTALETLFDGIAVYGLRNLFDVAKAYSIPQSVRSKLYYCGYVVRERKAVNATEVRRRHGLPQNGRLVVATAGGGKDGYQVLEAAQAAVTRLRSRLPDLCAIFVTGPFMPEEQRALLFANSPPASRVLKMADNFQLIAAADAVVGMGGYNSVWEALSLGRPLVIVPRATYKREQAIRAELLASHGLARWVRPEDLTGEKLAESLEWALRLDPLEHARRVRKIVPSFDGASRLTAYLGKWLGKASVHYPSPRGETSLVGQVA